MAELNRASIAHLRKESASWATELRKRARKDPSWSELAHSARDLDRAMRPCLEMAETVLPKSPKDWFPEKRKNGKRRVR